MLIYIRSCCLIFAVFFAMGETQSATKTIPLNRTLTTWNKELYGDFVTINRLSSLQVNFSDVGNVAFIIFQVHSHLYNVTLKSILNKWVLTGTNLGMYSSVVLLDSFLIENYNPDIDIKLFVTVQGYIEFDPIPGGCNLEFDLSISPFMLVNPYLKTLHNKSYLLIETAPPENKQTNADCSHIAFTDISLQFYMMYLPERNFEPDAYFEAIRNMTTLKNIKNAYLIPNSAAVGWETRRMVSAYPGTGAIYVAVAYKTAHPQNYSVYVPTHSYACSPLIEYDCDLIDDSITMFLSLILFFMGIFICYFGHWFFKTQIVTIGFLSGTVITYIIVSLIFNIENTAILKAAAISGLCIGALRLVCWWLFGIPAYIIVLSSADIGFLIASICYYMSPGGLFLHADTSFWSVFVLIILIAMISLLWTSHIASMICSALIGGYTTIYPLDYYMGSNLKYIINNAVRRATVPEFNKAIINPPQQWRDVFLIVIWVLLAVSGFLYQYYYNKGRPPFPPPPRSVRAAFEPPAEPTLRRRSSVAIFWATWLHRCRQRRTSSFVRTMNERSPLLEDVAE